MSNISKAYADALFEISLEENILEEIMQQTQLLGEVLAANPDFSKLLGAPTVTKEEKQMIIYDTVQEIPQAEIAKIINKNPNTTRVNIHRGIIDQIIGVGDVVLTSNNIADYYNSGVRVNGRPIGTGFGITISDIKELLGTILLICGLLIVPTMGLSIIFLPLIIILIFILVVSIKGFESMPEFLINFFMIVN